MPFEYLMLEKYLSLWDSSKWNWGSLEIGSPLFLSSRNHGLDLWTQWYAPLLILSDFLLLVRS